MEEGFHWKPLTYQSIGTFRLFNDNKQTATTAGNLHSGGCARRLDIAEKANSSVNSEGRSPVRNVGRGLLRQLNGIGEDNLGQAILVFRVGIGDVRFCLPQFGLTEFHNRSQSLQEKLLSSRHFMR